MRKRKKSVALGDLSFLTLPYVSYEMPTLGTHLSDDMADTVERAAKASLERRVAPWIAEAIRQRLDRDGLLPGSPTEKVLAKVRLAMEVDISRVEASADEVLSARAAAVALEVGS